MGKCCCYIFVIFPFFSSCLMRHAIFVSFEMYVVVLQHIRWIIFMKVSFMLHLVFSYPFICVFIAKGSVYTHLMRIVRLQTHSKEKLVCTFKYTPFNKIDENLRAEKRKKRESDKQTTGDADRSTVTIHKYSILLLIHTNVPIDNVFIFFVHSHR